MMNFKKMTKHELMAYIMLNMKNPGYNLNRAEYEAKGWNFDRYFNSLVKYHAAHHKKDELVKMAENVDQVGWGIRFH